MTKGTIIATALAALAVSACASEPAKTDTGAIEKELRGAEAKLNKAYADHDGAALAALYADDAAVGNPGSPLIAGKEAIARETAAFASDPNVTVQFAIDKIRVAQSGDLAYTRGHYTMTMTDPATKGAQTTTGNDLIVWAKQSDGSWKAVEDFVTPEPSPIDEGR